MGSKKHKKHKSERRERSDDSSNMMTPVSSGDNRPLSLKLILKVGNNSTPEHGNDSPAHGENSGGYYVEDYNSVEKHKKSKKKKKKKDREKKHKHHHKEKRRHRDDSSQEDMSFGEDNNSNLQENIMRFSQITTTNVLASMPVSKPMLPLKSPESNTDTMKTEQLDVSLTPRSCNENPKTPLSSDSSAREPRTCVLKLKQSKSPLAKLLDNLLKQLEKKDPHQFFAWPVTDDIAPGYSSIISKPMDFSTMRQKNEDNVYTTLQEFADDFKLMCDNAIRYNHVETVYHKASKRLLHIGGRMLQPENLMRSLRPLLGFLRDLTPKELGFEMPEHQDTDNGQMMVDSADECMSTGAEEINQAQIEEYEKRKAIRLINNPKSRFEAFVDDMTPDEILASVQEASKNARKRLSSKSHANKMGFLRQNKDGTTSMKILLDTENSCPERVISLGAFTGKLQRGTGQLQGFREDRRNRAKIIKPLNYGAFCSFAPVFDSRFSNLSKDESELVLNTYGDEKGAEYAESILEFTDDNPYASRLANSLLDFLTNGEHRKTMATVMENKQHRQEEKIVCQSFPDSKAADSSEKYDDVKIDFDGLRSLGSDLGVDMSFLGNLEQTLKNGELHQQIHDRLVTNSDLIEKLHQVQHDRLSQTLPAHLANVPRPNADEVHLASQITANLTEMAKQLPPNAITAPHAIRKALGVSNVGLPSFPTRVSMNLAPSVPFGFGQSKLLVRGDNMETSPVPVDVVSDVMLQHQQMQHLQDQPIINSSVDLENELRELFETESTLNNAVSTGDTTIEQMLLD